MMCKRLGIIFLIGSDNMNISVLYEDDDVLVLDKPVGLLVHGDGRSTEKTLSDWVADTYPDMREVGESLHLATGDIIERPGIVHRLDKDTSGVIIVCKTKDSFAYMKNEFQERRIHKKYTAFVYDNIKEDNGIIDASIGRSPKDFRQWSAEKNARGELREATTRWKKVVSTKEHALLEVYPETGRTHQIRVHLKHIEHPIIADPLYAPNRKHLLGFERLALHAKEVSFTALSGNLVKVESPYPTDFIAAIEAINRIAKAESL